MGLILDSSVVIDAERRGETVEQLIGRVIGIAGDQEGASATGADPSPQVLAFLSRKGMRVKGASTCYKAVKGNVISIELVSEDGSRLSAKVALLM